MTFAVIIPARYAASRLPGKLLLELAGKPVLQHTIKQCLASAARRVIVATDDERIRRLGEAAGAEAVMTAPSHATGTDRIQEAAAAVGLGADEIVVNVQGDEPLIPVAAINQVARNLAHHGEAGIATLCEPVSGPGEFADPNAVKVVRDLRGFALYFSRCPIPHQGASGAMRHIGIYAYRVELLNRFIHWPQTALERSERLEQLRALGQGEKVHVGVADARIPPGIDTREDLEANAAFLAARGGAS